MGGFFYRWRRPLIVIVAIIATSAVLSYTAGVRGKIVGLSNLLATAVSPASASLTFLGHQIGTGVTTVRHVFTLEKQNQALKQKLLQYNSMKLELSQLIAQNGHLRGLLALRGTLAHWHLQAADIISRNPNAWFQTVVINRGASSGIHTGMAVIVPQGVVGRVIAVTPATATVMLALDPKSGIGAIDVRSQSVGVIEGRDPVTGTLKLQLFAHHPDIAVGDAIITSGYSQYYPKGLLIGQVVSVKHVQFGLTEQARVKPAVNFNRLQTVMVVLSHPSGNSVPPIFGGN